MLQINALIRSYANHKHMDHVLGRELFDLADSGDGVGVQKFCAQHAERIDSFINWRNNGFTQVQPLAESYCENYIFW
jgi:hypothetical protein